MSAIASRVAYGKGGTGSNGLATTIDGGHLTVPSNYWKAIVVLLVGNSDVRRVSTSTRAIAVNMPTANSISTFWGSASVAAIESATGYNLLSAVSSTIKSTIEAKTDTGPTN